MSEDWNNIETWMQRYQHRLTRAAAAMTGDREAAEDIAQETFIRAGKNMHRFQGNASAYTYLYRIASNLAVDYLRRRRKGERRSASPVCLEALPSADETAQPETAALRAERTERVRSALAALPDTYRLPAALHYLGELGIEEISSVLGIPKGTVKSRLHRGRRLLKAALIQEGFGE
jgi:RNA polymerase sigma-70 factor, ECF subfamily